jgi:hypothetical protein
MSAIATRSTSVMEVRNRDIAVTWPETPEVTVELMRES